MYIHERGQSSAVLVCCPVSPENYDICATNALDVGSSLVSYCSDWPRWVASLVLLLFPMSDETLGVY